MRWTKVVSLIGMIYSMIVKRLQGKCVDGFLLL